MRDSAEMRKFLEYLEQELKEYSECPAYDDQAWHAFNFMDDLAREIRKFLDGKAYSVSKGELKPCPFCGGEATLSTGGEHFVVPECSKCGAKLPASFGADRAEKAIAAWNSRVELEEARNIEQ